jgi:hypothetical protein
MNAYEKNNCVRTDLAERIGTKTPQDGVSRNGVTTNGDQAKTNGGNGYVIARSGAGKAVYYDGVSGKLRLDAPAQTKKAEIHFNPELIQLLSNIKNRESKCNIQIKNSSLRIKK